MAAGWFPDPGRRHQFRYYNGSFWTDYVADLGVTSVEALPPLPQPAVASPPPVPVPQPDAPAPAAPPVPAAPPAPQLPAPQLPAPQLGPTPPLPDPAAAPVPRPSVSDSARQLNAWSERRMREAAVWWTNRRGGGSDRDSGLPVLDDVDEPTVLGQWSGLAGAVIRYGMSTSGVAASGDLLGLLQAVTGASDAQGRILKRIDAKIDALVLGPYQTGRTHLSEAARVGPEDETQREHIEEAKDCFYLAHGQAVSVQSRALVEFHLGVAWLLLSRRSDALFWFAQSYASAVTVAREFARLTDNIQVLHSRTGTAAASYYFPAGVVVLGMKFKKVVAAEQARQMLQEFLPFVACAARSHNALAEADAAVPALQLNRTAEGAELVEVAAR